LISAFTSQQTQHQHRLALDLLLALFYNDILRCSIPPCPPPPALQASDPVSDSASSSSTHEADFYVSDALDQWRRQQQSSLTESPPDLAGEIAPAQSAIWARILLYAFLHISLMDSSHISQERETRLQKAIEATLAIASNSGQSPEA
jgi:hypothetical protein